MKKLLLILTVIFSLCAFQSGALANSGPTHRDGTVNGFLTVDRDCPVTVEHEDLKFIVSEGRENSNGLLTAEVTASYEMKNPSNETVSVTMAFPSVGRVGENAVSSVTADGASVDYTVYYGAEVQSGQDENGLSELDLEDVLGSVSVKEPVSVKYGTLYTIIPVVENEAEIDDGRYFMSLSFLISENAQALFDGFGSYSREEDGTVSLGEWIYDVNEQSHSVYPATILAVDGAELPEMSVTARKSYDSQDNIDGISFKIEKSEMPLREYLERRCYLSGRGNGMTDAEYWCMMEYYYDGIMEAYGNAADVSDMWLSFEFARRLCLSVYTVDFEPGETKNVTVVSELWGTMDRLSGYSDAGTTYTFTYLSNPAKNWASFGTLDMKIELGEEIGEEISASVPELTKGEDGTYTASLKGLPEENITFVIGDEATAVERWAVKWKSMTEPLAWILLDWGLYIIIGLLIVAAVVVSVIRAKERRVKKRNSDK